MRLSQLAKSLSWRMAWEGWRDRDAEGAYTSDLLSDVMAHAQEGEILITIQAHKNTVAVAVLQDMAAILIASNRPLPEDMLDSAREEDIPLFVTGENQYVCSWKIHEQLSGGDG